MSESTDKGMEFTYTHFASDGYFQVVAKGRASIQGFADLDRGLVEHPEWRAGMHVLLDCRDLDFTFIRGEDVRESAEISKSFAEQFGNGRYAVVLKGEANFGLGRMWEMFTREGVSLEIRVFRSWDEALYWVRSGAPPKKG